jgi:hypothetical protein
MPRFWQRLSPSDQQSYISLRNELSTPKFSNQRGRSTAQFGVMLDLIKAFVVRGDEDDLSRSLVCGLLWMSNGLAVNIQQMKLLTSKCKSSINGSFGHLGYLPVQSGADTAGELIQAFPFMKDQFSELRQWTIRKPSEDSGAKPSVVVKMQSAFEIELNPFETGFSLEDEYMKLLAQDCPSGSLTYITPPADFDGEIGEGMEMGFGLGVKDEDFDMDRGFSMLSNDATFSMP